MNSLEWHRALAAAGLPVLTLEVEHGAHATTVVIGVAAAGGDVWASVGNHGSEYRAVVTRGDATGTAACIVNGAISDVIAAIAAMASRRTTLDKVHSQE